MKQFMELQLSSNCFYDHRWDVLDKLDLSAADWEYLDQIEN